MQGDGMMSSEGTWRIETLGGLRVLFVMAIEHEYGAHLRRLISPLMTGVGPVEAAASLADVLARLDHGDGLPDLVFSLGSAGSRSLDHAGIYQLASVAYRDMDATALGFPPGLTPFLGEPAVIAMDLQLPGVPAASIATGASIVSGAAYDGIGAQMVDMESYGLVRAARRAGVPLVGLRGISDGREDLTGLHDWTRWLHLLDEKLAREIERFADYAPALTTQIRSASSARR